MNSAAAEGDSEVGLGIVPSQSDDGCMKPSSCARTSANVIPDFLARRADDDNDDDADADDDADDKGARLLWNVFVFK